MMGIIMTAGLPTVDTIEQTAVEATEPTPTNPDDPFAGKYERPILATHAQRLAAYNYETTQDPKFIETVQKSDPKDILYGDRPRLIIGDEIWSLKMDKNGHHLELELEDKTNKKSQKLIVKHNPNLPGQPNSVLEYTEITKITREDGGEQETKVTFKDDGMASWLGNKFAHRFRTATTSPIQAPPSTPAPTGQ